MLSDQERRPPAARPPATDLRRRTPQHRGQPHQRAHPRQLARGKASAATWDPRPELDVLNAWSLPQTYINDLSVSRMQDALDVVGNPGDLALAVLA
jgi:hypothetical protein